MATPAADEEDGAGERAGMTTLSIPLSGKVRIAGRVALLLLALGLCVPLHYLYRIFAYGSPFPRLFLALVARIAGAKVEIAGTPLRRDVFFIANHVSWIDIPALAGASGTAFVAKAELGQVPVIAWLCGLNRTVFVRREARLDVASQINDLREALADNWSVTVFPEGTTGDGRSLLPFKTAMLKVLDPPPPGIMVQPVLLDYGPAVSFAAWLGDEPGIHNACRILARPGSFRLTIHFLEPFDPADHGCRKTIAAIARSRIEAEMLGHQPR